MWKTNREIPHAELYLILERFKIMMEEETDRYSIEQFIEQENFRRKIYDSI